MIDVREGVDRIVTATKILYSTSARVTRQLDILTEQSSLQKGEIDSEGERRALEIHDEILQQFFFHWFTL